MGDARLILVLPLAFICEFIDSSLGGGYGTSLTPLLLLLGFEPLQIVPAVLFSEFVTGVTAGFFHHKLNNVDFRVSSKDTKVAAVLSGFGVVGTVTSVVLAIKLPGNLLKICIGVIVVSMAVAILVNRNRRIRFSWPKIAALGMAASFNKGLSGGGYGPLVTGGQMLSGVGVRNAVAITSISEGLTCLVGVVAYLLMDSKIEWTLAPYLTGGALLSAPLAARTLRCLPEHRAKVAVGLLVFGLGALTLGKAYFGG